MIPMTSVEVLQDMLRFAKNLTPLLTEKKLETVIAGLSEAKETVAKYKEIQAEIQAAQSNLAKAVEISESNQKAAIELDAKATANAEAVAKLASDKKELEALVKMNESESAKLAKLIAQNEKKAAELDALLAKAKVDGEEIETAKAAITAKLAKLAEVA